MMSEQDKKNELAEHVEEKIIRYMFMAKNFTKDEMDFVDRYCKEMYGNNRKLMIMDLIRYKEENLPLVLINEKVDYLFQVINNKDSEDEQKQEHKKVKGSWKGLVVKDE